VPGHRGRFNLALRQAMCMAHGLLELVGLNKKVPDFSTIHCVRNVWR
jgi:hypothetical protein